MHNLTYQVPDAKKVRVILDSDTACEADDPFALAQALMSPKLMVCAMIAAHFGGGDTMQRSFDGMQRLTDAMDVHPLTLHGEREPIGADCEPSEGVRFLIEEAMREDSHPLYVLCMGAVTNVARALQLRPEIGQRMTVVTIGGRSYDPEDGFNGREFNFGNDVAAANLLLASSAQVWQIPICAYGTMRVGLAELQRKVAPCGKAGAYLYQQMVEYNSTPYASWTMGESWSLGDSPSVGVVLHPGCGHTHRQRIRTVLPDTSYGDFCGDKTITVYDSLDTRYILEDFFSKLSLNYFV